MASFQDHNHQTRPTQLILFNGETDRREEKERKGKRFGERGERSGEERAGSLILALYWSLKKPLDLALNPTDTSFHYTIAREACTDHWILALPPKVS